MALENIANSCFVSGPANSSGLKVKFRMQNLLCCAEFTPGPAQMGYDDVTHGGILFSLLYDESEKIIAEANARFMLRN